MALYLTKKGVWYTRFEINGREIRRSTGTREKSKAKAFEDGLRKKIKEEILNQELGIPVNRTFGDALARWMEGGYPKSMLSHIRQVRAYMENTPLELSVVVAYEMRDKLIVKGLAPSTVNRRLAVVRRVLNLAYKRWQWLREPLGTKISLDSEAGRSREIFLERDQVMKLVGAMRNVEAKKIVLLAAYTGLRRGELLRLAPEHWRRPIIRLTSRTKGKRPRSVPVVPELHWILDGLPFKVTTSELRYDFERARKESGMPHVWFHDLRHTFASWLAEDPNIPLTVIRDLLGHASLETTNRYVHLRTAALEKAVGGLPALNLETETE